MGFLWFTDFSLGIKTVQLTRQDSETQLTVYGGEPLGYVITERQYCWSCASKKALQVGTICSIAVGTAHSSESGECSAHTCTPGQDFDGVNQTKDSHRLYHTILFSDNFECWIMLVLMTP